MTETEIQKLFAYLNYRKALCKECAQKEGK